MRRIFLSFTRADEAVKNEIKAYLRGLNRDYDVRDSDDYCASDYSGECIDEIRDSQIFVAIVSRDTMLGGGYCKNELIFAEKQERLGRLNILLFKLCDGEFTSDFEFHLNHRSDLNSLTRGTKDGYPKLAEKIEHFLTCRENGKPIYEDLCNSLMLDSLAEINEQELFYREAEVKQIEAGFENSNVVFIQGVSGIGKMNVARGYYTHRKDLKAYRAQGGMNLRSFIASMELPSLFDSPSKDLNAKYTQNIKFLSRISPNVLIVGNNVSADDIDDQMLHDLQNIGAKLLITTQGNVGSDKFPVVKVEPLGYEALCELFYSRYECEPEDRERLSEHLIRLIESVGSHTGALLFIADTFKNRCYDVDTVIESINELDFEDDGSAPLNELAISRFFDVEGLSDKEQDMLFYLSYTPGRYISLDVIREHFKSCGTKDLSAINLLKAKGYINGEGKHAVSVSDAVAIVASNKIVPSEFAKAAVICMMFAYCDLLSTPEVFDIIYFFCESFGIANIEAVKATVDFATKMLFKLSDSSIENFLESFKVLDSISDDPYGLIYNSKLTVSSFVNSLSAMVGNEAFAKKAEELELSRYFGGDSDWLSDPDIADTLGENYLKTVSQLNKSRDEILKKYGKINYSHSITLEDLKELSSNAYNILDLTSQIIDDDELDLSLSFIISAAQTEMIIAFKEENFDGVISIYGEYKELLEQAYEQYEGVEEQLLWILCCSYYHLGNRAVCFELGNRILNSETVSIATKFIRTRVNLLLLRLYLAENDYASAKRCIEEVSQDPTLEIADELLIADAYAHVQMFDGDWYALSDYINNTLSRYAEDDYGYINSLKNKLAECEGIIESIEQTGEVTVNERVIVDAEDSEAYKEYLKKQIGKAEFKVCEAIVSAVLKSDLSALTDTELKERANALSVKLKASAELKDSQIIEAFSLTREAGYRVLGMKHHMIQLFAAALMVKGYSTQIQNGEGKTFTVVLPAVVLALSGRKVDIVSSSRYLSERDFQWMGNIYRLLGIEVGNLSNYWQDVSMCRVVYTSVSNLSIKSNYEQYFFNTKSNSKQWDCAIVDEADLILADDITRRLVWMNSDAKRNKAYAVEIKKIYAMLSDGTICSEDYSVNNSGGITVCQSAVAKLSKALGFDIKNVAEVQKYREILRIGILTVFIWKNGIEYSIRDSEPIFEDKSTGQSYKSAGDYTNFLILKEGLDREISLSDDVLYENYTKQLFKRYKTLIGTSGSMIACEKVLQKHYGIRCVDIPTNKKIKRIDWGYRVFGYSQSRDKAVLERVYEAISAGRPVLIVTPNREEQYKMEQLLTDVNIDFDSVGYHDEDRAFEVFSTAGLPGAVTVSTSLAGRGTDIVLGGNPKFCAELKMKEFGYSAEDIALAQTNGDTDDARALRLRDVYRSFFAEQKELCDKCKRNVLEVGGLLVIGTSLMESLRHEQQVRGRSGRQGEPGESEFIISLEDKAMQHLISDGARQYLMKFAVDGVEIGSKMMTGAMKSAQTQYEQRLLDSGENSKYVTQSEMCKQLYGVVFKMNTDDEYLVKRLLELLNKPIDGKLNKTSEAVKERIVTHTAGRSTGLFRRKAKPISAEELFSYFEDDFKTPQVYRLCLEKAYHNVLKTVFAKTNETFRAECYLADINGIPYSKVYAKWEKEVFDLLDGLTDSMLIEAFNLTALCVQKK